MLRMLCRKAGTGMKWSLQFGFLADKHDFARGNPIFTRIS